MQGRGERSGGRGLAAVYAVLLGAASVFFAVLAALGSSEDVWLVARGLLFSVLSGVAAIACALRAMLRPILAPTLALGLLPAAAELLWLAVR